ncbi:MAG: hypothetical protein ACLFVP_05555 [Candidatus Bathyarchaeia archaeon]
MKRRSTRGEGSEHGNPRAQRSRSDRTLYSEHTYTAQTCMHRATGWRAQYLRGV